MATTIDTMQEKQWPLSLTVSGVLIVLAIGGLGAWVIQHTKGMVVTGVNSQVVWGLYIAGFFTAAAAGAGLLALVGLSEFRALIPKGRQAQMLVMAVASFFAAGLLITMDVGNPANVWRIATAFQFKALMTLDFWALIFTGMITLVYLGMTWKLKDKTRLLGVLAMITALVLVVIEGLMLAELAARPLWGGPTVLSFLVGAVIAGLGLALLALPGAESQRIRKWMAGALGMSLTLVVIEVLTGLLSGNPRSGEEIRSVVLGTASLFFWFHIIGGLLLPLFLIAPAFSKARTGLVAILALLGVLASKLWVLIAGQEQPWLALPRGSYFPTGVEFLVVLGVVSLGMLAYALLLRLVRFWPTT